MLIDTHCHLNMMVKSEFDVSLTPQQVDGVALLLKEAKQAQVGIIINVGTSMIENKNCILLATTYPTIFAAVGIHPNDISSNWKEDIKQLTEWVHHKEEHKIIAIGECGIDKHYPNYNLQKQSDVFRAQIEIALTHQLPLIVHSRDAYDETLRILEQYKNDGLRGIMHCFSYDYTFAQQVIEWSFVLGIGGTITYPKNGELRAVVQTISLSDFVLETDAPFLPVQQMRGKQNHPQYIKDIAQFIADLRNQTFEEIMQGTTNNVERIFGKLLNFE